MLEIKFDNPTEVGFYVIYTDPPVGVRIQCTVEKAVTPCEKTLAFWDGEKFCTVYGGKFNRRVHGYVGMLPSLNVP